jgi:restriction system protein
MKRYFKLMLGRKSKFAEEAYNGNFIGMDFLHDIDLSGQFPENWREFNKKYIPVYLERREGKTRIAAGLACGALWTLGKGIKQEDIVLCPNGEGSYYVGEITSDYSYHKDTNLPHRREVKWYPLTIDRASMSDALRSSTGSAGTVSDISKHETEIRKFIDGNTNPPIVAVDETIEDPIVFALEKHLEEFLIQNWKKTELGKKYNIFELDGELVGQQFLTDTGPIDILAINKDKKELLVVELKKGRVSDNVVGQIQRYMGYVQEELAENGQIVKGVIIGLDDDLRIKRALSVTNNIEFYKYKVNFTLYK